MKALLIVIAVAATAACEKVEHNKDAAENYNAGSLADVDRKDVAGTTPPTSEACRRAQECYSSLTRDLCSDDQCSAALAPPPGNSDQGACANAVRDARLKATP